MKKKVINYIDENYKKIFIFVFTIIIVVFMIFLIIYKNDETENAGIANIRYRVYIDNNWGRWKKNGITVGDKKNNIKQIEVKFNEDITSFDYYYDGKWSLENKKRKNVTGIRIINSAYFLKKYDMCYRTYNKKNEWLNWSCNGAISGNSAESITALEIKVIPKNVIKSEYLKDYIENENSNMIGF